jgi:hypothetical protein
MKKYMIAFSVLIFLWSCSKDSEYVYPTFTSIATVENPDSTFGFRFITDNNDVMKVASTYFPNYRPKTGQRILANYSILSEGASGAGYNHKVELNDVYQVLTKAVFKISSSTQDSIGNDAVEIRNIWVGSHFLNVEFVFAGYEKMHFINLVSDASKIYTDGKVHLEFRHNANSDYQQYSRWGLVSFDLNSIKSSAVGDSVAMVIHTKEFATPSSKTYQLTWKIGASGMEHIRDIKMLATTALVK